MVRPAVHPLKVREETLADLRDEFEASIATRPSGGAVQSDGYVETYRELIETTDWSKYGRRAGTPSARSAWPTAGTSPPR